MASDKDRLCYGRLSLSTKWEHLENIVHTCDVYNRAESVVLLSIMTSLIVRKSENFLIYFQLLYVFCFQNQLKIL